MNNIKDDVWIKPTFTGDWYADNFIMNDILSTIDYYSGTERRKMLKVPAKQGGSMLYGITWRGYLSPTKNRTKDEETGLYKTKIYDLYPELKNIFKEFSNLYFPNHQWEQVQMNKNFPCPPHQDSTNIGESVLCCFGDYEGGATKVYYNKMGIKAYDAREAPIKFDGSKHLHWVEPIKNGDRYSLVFFSNDSVRKLVEKNKKKYMLII